jgi:hydrogenase maturation protein HypF
MTRKLARRKDESGPRFATVALSGGCFQNRILFEEVVRRLEAEHFNVLTHAQVPANDGGLALGQAAIGAAQLIDNKNKHQEGNTPCASEFQAVS